MKTSQLRLDPFTIFIDENHSKNPHILKVLAEHLQGSEKFIPFESVFPSGTLDEEWLPQVGKNAWILISADSRLWRRSVLRQALFQAGVRAFIFTENVLRGETRGEILRKALPEMRTLVRENSPPFVGSLTIDGHAHILYDSDFHREIVRRELKSKRRRMKTKLRSRSGGKIKGTKRLSLSPLRSTESDPQIAKTKPDPKGKPRKKST